MFNRFLSVAALATAVSTVSAQTALIREGDLLTGGPAGHTITGFNIPAINSNGGYAVTLSSSDGSTTLSQAWGSPMDGVAAPDIFLWEQTVGSLVQTSWETLSFGIGNAGELGYSTTGTGGPVGSFDSIWRDLTPIIVEGDPIAALPGKFWRFGSRPKSIDDGTVVFVGGITSTAGGSTESYGLFRDDQPVLLGGDVVPGLPFPLTPTGSAFSFDFQYSRNGAHYMVEVDIDTLGTGEDNAMITEAGGLLIGGSLVREGTLVPVVAGGDGVELWDNFDYVAILNDGQYLFTGDTDADAAQDEFIVKNGTIIKREGEMVSGFVLDGSIEGATMNENGDVAYIWDVDNAGTNVEVLVYNDQIILMEGDDIDVDGDGIADAGNVIDDFESGSQLCLTDSGEIYVVIDVNTPGGLIEIFYRVDTGGGALGTNYCTAGANSLDPGGALMSAAGSNSIAAADLTLKAAPAPNQPFIFYYGPNQNNLAFGNGFRCVAGTLVRLPAGVGSNNEMTHVVDFVANGGNFGTLGTVNFQCWYRDPAGGGAFFNLSDGYEIVFTP